MRRTKILATIGPASMKPGVLEQMIAAGLDAVRLNFSHGTHEAHAAAYARVREAAARAGRYVAVLQDLQGPKIRIGRVAGDGMDVPTGSTLVVTTREVEGGNGVVSTVYKDLPRDVAPGMRVLLDEGRLELVVRSVSGEDVLCDVADGGRLSSNKGISVPGATLTAAAMTDKDREDVRFGLRLGVDFVALSFVRRASDVTDLRALMDAEGRRVPIIAKIEKPQAIERLDEIVAAADGLMVARGDLAIEVSLEMIPVHQKFIIERANRAGKLVITATQMLESMTDNPLPTRAEVTDVANAVLDGTDAVMLSGESAVGKYPVEAVRRMGSIAETAEEQLYPFDRALRPAGSGWPPPGDLGAVAARLAGHAAREALPAAIAVYTRDGRTAQLVSDERPRAPVLALSPDETACRRLALYWGVIPHRIDEPAAATETLAAAERALVERGLAKRGETFVCVAGAEPGEGGGASSIRLARVGDSVGAGGK